MYSTPGHVHLDMKDEVLQALPRTMRIDGLEIIKKIKASIRLKVDAAAMKIEEDLKKQVPGFISLGYTIDDETPIDVDYDRVIGLLDELIAEKKVSKTNADLPTFQRID